MVTTTRFDPHIWLTETWEKREKGRVVKEIARQQARIDDPLRPARKKAVDHIHLAKMVARLMELS
jgi:hypothetical protein